MIAFIADTTVDLVIVERCTEELVDSGQFSLSVIDYAIMVHAENLAVAPSTESP